MNDLEIERQIADIENIHYMKTKYKENNFLALVSENDFSGTPPEMIGKYSPLTDNALCFHLMVKHQVDLEHETDGGDYSHHRYVASLIDKTKYKRVYGFCKDSPNRAILLAILKAKKTIP